MELNLLLIMDDEAAVRWVQMDGWGGSSLTREADRPSNGPSTQWRILSRPHPLRHPNRDLRL
jgi:hypothetical protein